MPVTRNLGIFARSLTVTAKLISHRLRRYAFNFAVTVIGPHFEAGIFARSQIDLEQKFGKLRKDANMFSDFAKSAYLGHGQLIFELPSRILGDLPSLDFQNL